MIVTRLSAGQRATLRLLTAEWAPVDDLLRRTSLYDSRRGLATALGHLASAGLAEGRGQGGESPSEWRITEAGEGACGRAQRRAGGLDSGSRDGGADAG